MKFFRRHVGVAVLVAMGAVTGITGVTAGSDSTELQQRLDGLLADSRYQGSQVALVVRDATTGEVLYDRNSGNRVLPASNTKLFTSAAALETLGADFRFHTDVLTTGKTYGGVLAGPLYLKGYGDPTSLESDYRALARQVAATGIRRVVGDLVADDTFFDNRRLGNGWSWDDESFYYSAQTSALTVAPDTDYDSGTVIVESAPGATVGAPAQLKLIPQTSAVQLVNTSKTGPAGSAYTLNIERDHGSNVVRITGSIPADDTGGQDWVAVWEPANYAADIFRRALAAEGVQVLGKIRTGATPATSRRLAHDESMTMAELMVPFMKLSNNMHGEALLKRMGNGDWDRGLAVTRSYLQSNGVDVAAMRMVDGSGLSRMNNLTADGIADLLVAAQREPWFGAWYASLPIAGNADRAIGGTLRNRMRNTAAANNVHAKTGTLTGVTALSGYVTNADGRKLVFSFVSNNFMVSPRPIEDAVAITLASWSDRADVPTITPNGQRVAPAEAELECSKQKDC
ncbi:D-alanyl-D-alanine carboxypeptidase/D-alanyl-D-alanine endopeptidase [Kribbella deserti]|uniref:D-alanyl-D-alanine carboxypeptidase/D-alanyl-D-alanine-endopeptidase n=1 Tax=Kribbella deserti TaxID=1926257 RepID=A0ABV6QKU6_9ACTN